MCFFLFQGRGGMRYLAVAGVQTCALPISPAPGSIAWKLRNNQRVNLLMLGYGGAENDAPYLTDSMVVASLDPADKRVMLVSVPRDLSVRIDAFQNQSATQNKINTAYAVGIQDDLYHGKIGRAHV